MSLEIMIVDDEADIRELTAGILEDEGYLTRKAASSDEALAAIATRRPSLVLLDIWLQGSALDGIEILSHIQAEYPGLPVVMMSGHGNIETAVTAINLGAYDFIEKPFNSDRLLLITARALEASRLRRENEELRQRAGTENELIGKSTAINQVRQALDRVAPANSRVLISGPAGSGKEVAARLLHKMSGRSGGPFVVLNCASMAPEKVEMELFGLEASDDDTAARKTGTFEAAHNGTLLLDEVGDMPLETQGKIVRVLQEQIFERIGGTTKVEVDVRVVASTSRDLSEEMASGNFREDLFYRLSVVPIELPPLSARIDDIAPLAEHFIARAAGNSGRSPRTLALDAIAALQAYSWPGNVRELKNIIERLLIMAPENDEEAMGMDILPPEISGRNSEITSETVESINGIMGLPLRKAREAFEREYLNSQVSRFGGNISRTATFVGMERSALHRKLKTLGIDTAGRTGQASDG
ncbi:MAG: sigma-54-dependent Fis family transcriptional regulator [Rhodospirillaceae bacterium]|jgi:two-component system, NtrC family, nitrogen regulation response regulator NtrX|nr:sigma-54-dependent Fis family transcriptional regulator [Rhodospirillaceae bacterium]MBT5245024.1 sigma-54-dependent Fis family transcriptional regulator [Rhodospirillaceae bacterium]MBT5561090.1 sigma-54-dependent Fis family transcriptional regulator [Rhodospirillaceae bacterium]MBT6241025.1 sigma-54-dependent Fis family transcriptional regulator [Rhodospirillaceae bacterium]